MTRALSPPNTLWPQVWGLALVQGAIALTWVIYNLYLVQLLKEFGFSAALATGLLVLENTLAAVMEPLMGSFSDRAQHALGTRFPFIALGSVLASACFIGIPAVLVFSTGTAITRWLLPTMLAAWAIAMTIFRSPSLSLLGRYAVRTHLPQATSILTLVSGLAGAMAPLAGNFILSLGPLVAFFVGSLTLLAAAAALGWVGPNQSIQATDASSPRAESAPSLNPISLQDLGLTFGAGMGVALGFRLVMQVFPTILSAEIPAVDNRLVLGSIFVALAVTAIPAGKVAAQLGMPQAMLGGLAGMALLSVLMLLSSSLLLALVVAIALGAVFSLVSNTTLPFALSMVPPQRAGLGTGMYFSGGAVATSLYGMAVGQGFEISNRVGAVGGAIAFLIAAACVLASLKRPYGYRV